MFFILFNRTIRSHFLILGFLLLYGTPIWGKNFDLNVISFPNPFNPSLQTLTIQPSKEVLFPFTSTLSVIIYDINFKKILEDNQQIGSFRWSGFTLGGQRVAPGLYYFKIIEERMDKSIGMAWIKILVR